ncbi:lysoplasmalogenase family protein [Caproiciproducens sp. LBM24188]|nr:lysoplasmalogenase [Oscillospiraceae bacterium]
MSITLCILSVAAMGFFFDRYFHHRKDYKDNKVALIYKASGTLVPVLLCLYALLRRAPAGVYWLLFTGIFLCMAADVVIGIRFEAGTLVFLVAQLCLIAYYFTLAPFHWVSILLFFGILILEALILKPSFSYPLNRLICCGAYALALAFMVSMALLLPFSVYLSGTILLAVGAVLFLISDTMLAQNTFGKPVQWRDRLLMAFYYSAVYLMAVSTFYL